MRWLVLTTMVFFAATCGQKGPLTRPTPEQISHQTQSTALARMTSEHCLVPTQLCPGFYPPLYLTWRSS